MAYKPLRAGEYLRTVLEGTPLPLRLVGILLKFLDQDDDFSTTVTSAYRHSDSFSLDLVEVQLSSQMNTEDDFFLRTQALLALTVDTTLAAAMVAKNISQSLDKLTDDAQRADISVQIATKFQDRFGYFAGKLGVKGFFDGMPCDGTDQAKRNRFYSAIGNLPLYSEDMSMDELDDKAFPNFKTIVPGDINFQLQSHIYSHLSAKKSDLCFQRYRSERESSPSGSLTSCHAKARMPWCPT